MILGRYRGSMTRSIHGYALAFVFGIADLFFTKPKARPRTHTPRSYKPLRLLPLLAAGRGLKRSAAYHGNMPLLNYQLLSGFTGVKQFPSRSNMKCYYDFFFSFSTLWSALVAFVLSFRLSHQVYCRISIPFRFFSVSIAFVLIMVVGATLVRFILLANIVLESNRLCAEFMQAPCLNLPLLHAFRCEFLNCWVIVWYLYSKWRKMTFLFRTLIVFPHP